jgi:hypothetical protein
MLCENCGISFFFVAKYYFFHLGWKRDIREYQKQMCKACGECIKETFFTTSNFFCVLQFSREKLNKIQMTNKYDSIRFLLISERRCTEHTKHDVLKERLV